jgi:tRNA-Thr(GGU) m(6)t(6)A37 methyltransferase TsaA
MKPIGVIHSLYKNVGECPNQSYKSKEIAEVEVFEEYEDGLNGIDGFSHIVIVFLFHKSKGYSLSVIPFHSTHLRGVFATRSPRRPNPIGISIVRLIERRGNILKIREIDMIEGTPILDIKPYIPLFDGDVKIG